MKRYFIFLFLILGSVFCGVYYWTNRLDIKGFAELSSKSPGVIPPEDFILPDLLDTAQILTKKVRDPQVFKIENCAKGISTLSEAIRKLDAEYFTPSLANHKVKEINEALFGLRLSLRARLLGFFEAGQLNDENGRACMNATRLAFRTIRYLEDELLLQALNPKAFDPKTDKVAGNVLNDPSPILMAANSAPVKLRSGDVFLSRGNTFESAAIARIGKEEAQFSHLALVYIEAPVGTELSVEDADNDPRAHTIEAHIEVGAFGRLFKNYVDDGNGRVLQFRSKLPPEKAHQAAESLFNYVGKYQQDRMKKAGRDQLEPDDNPPYDFKMNAKDHREIFCAEVVSMAYENVGWNIPTFPSELRNNDLTQLMQITSLSTFAPADMEVEPRFDFLAEWRDVRKTAALLRKDVVLASIYNWMDVERYRFHFSPVDFAKAWVAWGVRHAGIGFQKVIPNNIPLPTVRLTFELDKVGEVLENHLKDFEAEYRKNHKGAKPSFIEEENELELFRQADVKIAATAHQVMEEWLKKNDVDITNPPSVIQPNFLNFLGP